MKFRVKPVIIEAMQFLYQDNGNEIQQWSGGKAVFVDNHLGNLMRVETPEGEILCRPSDWIIKDAKGEFHHSPHHKFVATYEPVEE